MSPCGPICGIFKPLCQGGQNHKNCNCTWLQYATASPSWANFLLYICNGVVSLLYQCAHIFLLGRSGHILTPLSLPHLVCLLFLFGMPLTHIRHLLEWDDTFCTPPALQEMFMHSPLCVGSRPTSGASPSLQPSPSGFGIYISVYFLGIPHIFVPVKWVLLVLLMFFIISFFSSPTFSFAFFSSFWLVPGWYIHLIYVP